MLSGDGGVDGGMAVVAMVTVVLVAAATGREASTLVLESILSIWDFLSLTA